MQLKHMIYQHPIPNVLSIAERIRLLHFQNALELYLGLGLGLPRHLVLLRKMHKKYMLTPYRSDLERKQTLNRS